jgi:hypothetical protein
MEQAIQLRAFHQNNNIVLFNKIPSQQWEEREKLCCKFHRGMKQLNPIKNPISHNKNQTVAKATDISKVKSDQQ